MGIQQHRIREGDEWKAAFKTNQGLFEPTVMFFGMCNSPAMLNFYRKFIPGFSTLAAPLNALLKKDTAFQWTEETQQSFDTLKQKLTSSPVLMMPDQTQPFQIECDASKYASGAVLTQQDNNGDRHPVAFLSKTFTETERNYEIYDRELLAIIRALEEWRHYIQGSGHTTIIYSDHQNLTYFRSAQKLNRRQA